MATIPVTHTDIVAAAESALHGAGWEARTLAFADEVVWVEGMDPRGNVRVRVVIEDPTIVDVLEFTPNLVLEASSTFKASRDRVLAQVVGAIAFSTSFIDSQVAHA